MKGQNADLQCQHEEEINFRLPLESGSEGETLKIRFFGCEKLFLSNKFQKNQNFHFFYLKFLRKKVKIFNNKKFTFLRLRSRLEFCDFLRLISK